MTDLLFDIVQITGQDSFKFLQGQITADLSILAKGEHTLSAYCNRQGQVISVFYISKNTDNQDDYTVVTLGDTGKLFINKIKKFAVFSKIKFELVVSTISLLNQYQVNSDVDFYITSKIPFITKASSEKYLANELNLVDLKAVSFKKGCFLGQEIIARVYYKGKPKKNIYHIVLENNNDSELEILESGAIIHNLNNDSTGEVLIAKKSHLLAIIQDRYLSDELYINKLKCNIAAV